MMIKLLSVGAVMALSATSTSGIMLRTEIVDTLSESVGSSCVLPDVGGRNIVIAEVSDPNCQLSLPVPNGGKCAWEAAPTYQCGGSPRIECKDGQWYETGSSTLATPFTCTPKLAVNMMNSVQVRIAGVHTLTLCEFEMFDAYGNKIPLYSPVQSSTKYTGLGGAEKAIDGNKTGRWSWDTQANTCTHTNDEDGPYWLARFSVPFQNVGKIVIHNRGGEGEACYGETTPFQGKCEGRLNGAEIRINNKPVYKVENADLVVTIPVKMTDDYVAPKCTSFSYESHDYQACFGYKLKAEGAAACAAWGGELARLESGAENKYIMDTVKSKLGLPPRGIWDSSMYVANGVNDLPNGLKHDDRRRDGYDLITNANSWYSDDNEYKYALNDMPGDRIYFGYLCKKQVTAPVCPESKYEKAICQIEKRGTPYNHIKNVAGNSVCDCMVACEATTDCVSFNYNFDGNCALKNRRIMDISEGDWQVCPYPKGAASYIKKL